MHTCTHAHMHTYTHAHIHTYTHTHIHTYAHTHIRTYTHVMQYMEDALKSLASTVVQYVTYMYDDVTYV